MGKKNKFIMVAISVCIIGIIFYFLNTYMVGNIDNVNESLVKSEVYSEEEIKEAMNIVKKNFKKDFKGCTLTDLWYGEGITRNEEEGWAKQYNAEEAIVLLSNFDVDSSGGSSGALNPNTTYKQWKWILVRNKLNKKWELKTSGLG